MINLDNLSPDTGIFQLDENICVIKNFISEEERLKIISLAESAEEDEWNKDQRLWWKGKILYVGKQDVLVDISYRVRSLFSKDMYEMGILDAINRMKVGESMDQHVDNPLELNGQNNYAEWGAVVYYNDFNGGEILYENMGISYKPESGDMVIHPANLKYKHGTLPVLDGPTRYSSTLFIHSADIRKNRIFAPVDKK